VFCVQEEIARALVDALRPQLLEGDVGAAAPPALLRPSTSDFEAYALYLRGRQRWNERTPQSLRDALGFFGAAVERDPGYAHAHAGTADGWAILVDHGIIAPAEGLPRAERAAAAALELRPDLAEAHASAGLIAQLQGRHGDAETAFRTALAADPGCLAARQRLALLLAWCGRFAEARAEMQQARLADPLSPLIAASRGWVEYFAGRYEDAIAIARRVIEGEPDFAPARIPLALSLAAAGRCEEAVGEARTCAAELATAPVLGVLAYVLGRCGHADEAAGVIERIDALSQETYVGRHVFAQAWSGLRRERETLAELEAARRAAEPQLNYVTVDPMLEWLGDRPALAG
ncbi:MAG TPA: tetratricopeptide repeat protein, partial [Longimicrobiales bacterium]|nr:tetratricopeptide repeat protein [Longimicrobiales bacterium]